MTALEDKLSSTDKSSGIRWTIKDAHFTKALEKISPSVSDKVLPVYCYILSNYTFLMSCLIFAMVSGSSKNIITSFYRKASKANNSIVLILPILPLKESVFVAEV